METHWTKKFVSVICLWNESIMVILGIRMGFFLTHSFEDRATSLIFIVFSLKLYIKLRINICYFQKGSIFFIQIFIKKNDNQWNFNWKKYIHMLVCMMFIYHTKINSISGFQIKSKRLFWEIYNYRSIQKNIILQLYL